jgi:hypothetical protein
MKRHVALALLATPFAPSVITAQTRAPRKIGLTAALTGPFGVPSVPCQVRRGIEVKTG